MALPQSLDPLRTRLFLVVALCLIPTFAVVLWQGIENKRRLDSNLRREAVSVAHEIAAYPKDVIPDPRVFLANLAERPEFIAGGEACDTLTAAIVKSNRYITNVKVISTGGKELCSGLHYGESANLADRSYFKRAIDSRGFAIGDYLVGQRSRKRAIAFAQPILDATKNVTGVVSIGVDLDWLADALGEAPRAEGTIISVVDASGILLADLPHHEDRIGRPIEDLEKFKPIIAAAREFAVEEKWRDGILRISAYVPLFTSSTGSVLLQVGIPKAYLLERVKAQFQRDVMWMAAAALAALILAWLASDFLAAGAPNTRSSLIRRGLMTEGLEARQENLRRVNLALTVLSAADRAMLHATDEQSLLTDICRIIVTIGGYNSAWIAFAQHDAQQPVKLAARWDADQRPGGFAAGDRAGDQPALGFARIAIGNERLCVIKNYQSQESECASFLALRLQVGDQAIGALVVAAAQRDAFGEREVALLSDTADDLAHRIASLRTALQPEWTAQSA